MKNDNEIRVCKKCKKVLPPGYPHKRCEACRNQQAEKFKKTIKGAGAGMIAIAGFAIKVIKKR